MKGNVEWEEVVNIACTGCNFSQMVIARNPASS